MARRIIETLEEYCNKHEEFKFLLDEYCEENELKVDEISIKDLKHDTVWYCKKHNHYWHCRVAIRTKYPKPPCCSGRVATETNNFTLDNKELLLDWDYDKNEIEPESLLYGSHKRVYWKCHKCGHEWDTILTSRTLSNSSCPNCSKVNTSKAEQLLLTYFKMQFNKTTHRNRYTDSNGVIHPELDVYIPEIKLAIEYDGYPWHINKINSHTKKLEYCRNNGILLLNIAEYKDSEESLTEVKNQYTDENNVLLFKINSTYSLDGLLQLVYEYLINNGFKTLINPSTIDNAKFKKVNEDYTIKSTENNSLGNELPWLSEWYSSKNKLALNEISKGSTSEVILQCPDCGREIKIKAHWIKSQFNGCSSCGSKRNIPQEQSDKIKAKNKESNKKAKIRRWIIEVIDEYIDSLRLNEKNKNEIIEKSREIIRETLKNQVISDNKYEQEQLSDKLSQMVIDRIRRII